MKGARVNEETKDKTKLHVLGSSVENDLVLDIQDPGELASWMISIRDHCKYASLDQRDAAAVAAYVERRPDTGRSAGGSYGVSDGMVGDKAIVKEMLMGWGKTEQEAIEFCKSYKVTVDSSGRVTELWLRDINLNGDIPERIGDLKALSTLYLRNNNLNGEIPERLFDLKALTNLVLGNNKLSGQVPTKLTNLIHLHRLDRPCLRKI